MTDPVDQPLPIEDYALIGDCKTAALVGRDGAIDWLCWPRFDSAACFAALLGTCENGRWRIAPQAAEVSVSRAYRDGTMVLETLFETADGAVAVVDFMPIGRSDSSVIRLVEGRRGRVAMRLDLHVRFDYGISVPWVTRLEDKRGLSIIAGPNGITLRCPVELRGEDLSTVADFEVGAGETVPFVMTYAPSHLPPPAPIDPRTALAATEEAWRAWSGRCTCDGEWRESVRRSLLTLKALTFEATGGIVAAPTTSLPERLGGARNWDYRYCWLRDATITLLALMRGGYFDEAQAWRDWLHRSIAGSPDQLQIMYGIAGERQLMEWEVGWLPGYQGAAPVRIGNAAAGQVQLDVYGEVMSALHRAREHGLAAPPSAWDLQRTMIGHLAAIWDQPDEGIWEVRGGRRHFTFSKIMAWVAMDRVIKDARTYGLEAPVEEWCALRDRIHETVCREGYDATQQSFTQAFGRPELDASLLLISVVGFLPPDDPRVRGTIAAIERDLLIDGFVLRYRTESAVDGLPPGEGVFLPCSFWLVSAYIQQGRAEDARILFRRLLALCNDVGLIAEEYDPGAGRLVGNFPQAFTHVALVVAAFDLMRI
ncbi:MAG TPA: glycoside hydrolase family 15 protein [Aliidongia sp.]|nr:glycoside hydrolase family 15 protein [Aliidongia sp.]